jgi:uronate dehydrogenase
MERGHTVRGFARHPSPELHDYVVGDLSEQDAVRRAVNGMEVVVHLGAYPNDADFLSVLLEPNVRGLFHICDAAREFKVQRLSLASSLQTVVGHGSPPRPIRIEEGPAPVNHYALTKVWAEEMGKMYARVHGISVINVRIGWLPRNPKEADGLKSAEEGPDQFLSHADAQRFYERVVESENPGPGKAVTVFATSKPAHVERLELEPARRILGYEPQDVWPNGLNFEYNL